MIKHYRFISFTALLSFALLSPAQAASPGSVIFPFLKVCTSARNGAMGESSSVLSLGTAVNNPAVLPWFDGPEFAFGHMSYLAQSGFSTVAGVVPVDEFSAAGFSAGYLGMPSMTRVIADNTVAEGYREEGSFDFYDAYLNASLGRKLGEEFSVGVGLRAVQENIDKTGYSGFGFSAGGLYVPENDNYYISAALFDEGPSVAGYKLPSGITVGYGMYVRPQMLWVLDGVYYADDIANLRTGFEYTIASVFSLRTGYRYSSNDNQYGDFPMNGLTAGAGFAFGRMVLDYAWIPYGDLGDTHRLTLTYRVGTGAENRIRTRTKYISDF